LGGTQPINSRTHLTQLNCTARNYNPTYCMHTNIVHKSCQSMFKVHAPWPQDEDE